MVSRVFFVSPDFLLFGGVMLGCMVQSLVVALALVTVAREVSANGFLALTLVVLAGMMSVFVLGWTGRADVPAWLAFLPVNLPLALGPALYAYVACLVLGVMPGWKHFVPAALQLTYLCVMQVLPDAVQMSWKNGAHDQMIKPLVEVATVVSLVAYTLMGLRVLGAYRAWLAQQRSDADRYAALWIGRVMVALAVTTGALALVRAYTTFVGELDSAPLYLWFAALSAWLGIEGWRQADRRYPVMQMAAVAESVEASGPDWVALGRRWQEQIQVAGWWREGDLALADVARRVGTNTSYLSRGINEGLGLNFNELINRMRAEEVARRIGVEASPNFLELALEAGFSSKATFNRAFRAVHGMSPSDYRERLKSQKSAGSQGSDAQSPSTPGT